MTILHLALLTYLQRFGVHHLPKAAGGHCPRKARVKSKQQAPLLLPSSTSGLCYRGYTWALCHLQGIQYLIEHKLLTSDVQDIAQFLYKGDGLNKTAIGTYLGEK